MGQRKDSKDTLGNNLEATYKTKIRYKCPKRGWIEEEVEVKRYKTVAPSEGTVLETEIESIPIEDLDDSVN
jgi:hypothetical protein